MITSPILCAVKIGHWGDTLELLRNRYVTSYGSSLEMHALMVADRRLKEKELHERFKAYRIENELFHKDKLSWYLENWFRNREFRTCDFDASLWPSSFSFSHNCSHQHNDNLVCSHILFQ